MEGVMNGLGKVGDVLVPRIRGPVCFLAVAAILTCNPFAIAASSDAPKLVVVVYPSEYDGAPGITSVNRAIRSTFAGQPPGQIEIRNEYVETSRSLDSEYMQAQVSLLQRKYAGRRVDLVIAGLSSGLDFALKFREELFPGVPIVFVAVDEREVKARRLPSDVIGIPIRMDLSRTLDLGLRLHPDTARVFVIAGSSPFDNEWEAEARRTFRAYEDRLEFVYLTRLGMDELLARVARLPDQSIVYFLHLHQDATGKPFFSAEVLERLAARANAPIYGHVDTYVGRGAVGGHVFRFDEAGNNAARLGLRILSGEKPETIATSGAGENFDMFDWRQLRRWGISEQSLPPGSIVLFKVPTFWDVYKWRIMGLAALCAVETILIAGLLIQRARRRRAELAGRESETRFALMADAAPILIWHSGGDKGCTYFNRPWLEFTGRPLEQELGGGWAEGVHPDDHGRCLEVYTTSFDARVPFEMVYRLRQHDGEYRWLLARGVPRFTPGGDFVGYIGACIDVSERRCAEEGLRDSQRELKVLTGRLLEAQEIERRRIARELHDGVNQSLALLAVEMDLLAASPWESSAETANHVLALSSQVKAISSSVHDLSHQLHPSKLEHLGLVATVRSHCKELSQSYGLDVKFTHNPELSTIPQDTALCLYRIVQEALQNIIKHSGSRHATVELCEAAGTICLRIDDDGIGFDTDAAGRNGGLGLVSMRERLHLVDGEMTIDSRPAGGTRINVCVPTPRAGSSEKNPQVEAVTTG
jgi:PAS domain S-box-containing protein